MSELDGQLDRLETSGLIRLAQLAPEIEYLFRHALVQDAAYSSLLKTDRRALHLAVAKAIEQAYPDRLEEFAPVLALHYAQAEDDAHALHYYTLAGDAASARYANAEAIQLYSAAIDIDRTTAGSQDVSHLYLQRGRCYEFLGDYARALPNYVALEDTAEQRQDSPARLKALMAQATIRATTTSVQDLEEAQRLLNAALALARDLGDRAAESKTLWNLMLYYKFAGNAAEAVKNGEASLKIARELDLREQLAFTMNDLVTHGYLDAGEFAKARSLIDEVPQLWQSLGNQPMLADSYSSGAIVHFLLGEYDRAIQAATQARQVSESIHNLWGESYSRWIVGQVYRDLGEVSTAIQTMEECVALGEQAGFMGAVVGVGSDLALLLGSLGRVNEGLEWAEKSLAAGEERLVGYLAWPLSALTQLQVLVGDFAAAAQTAQRIEHSSGLGFLVEFPVSVTAVYLALAAARLAANDFGGAHHAVDDFIGYLERTGMRPYRAEGFHQQGRIYLAQGQVEQARTAFQEARRSAEAVGSRWMLWRILAALGDLENQQGNQPQAGNLLQQARTHAQFIADHIDQDEIRESFLGLAQVKALSG